MNGQKPTRFRTLREKQGLSIQELHILFPTTEESQLLQWDESGVADEVFGRLIERVLSFSARDVQQHAIQQLVNLHNSHVEMKKEISGDIFALVSEVIKKTIKNPSLQDILITAFFRLRTDRFFFLEIVNDKNGNMTDVRTA